MNLKGTKTEQNIKMALAGESIARNKYTYFAEQAKKEGNTELVEMYERLARNEATNAKLWYIALHGAIPDSVQNLRTAATGEFEEWSHMYPDFAKTAREEGLEQMAVMFEHVAEIEKNHEKQFMEAIIKQTKQSSTQSALTEKEKQFIEDTQPMQKTKGYRCAFCGATYDHRPDVCTVCQAIGSFDVCTISK